MAKLKLESSNVVYLAICVAAVALFIGIGIFPNLNALKQFDGELRALQQQIDSQALLSPVFRNLIEETKVPLPAELSPATLSKIDQGSLNHLNEIFTELARAHGVILKSVIPDAGSYHSGDERLSLNAVFVGDFFDFRSLVMAICRLPFVNSIEKMRIETDQDSKRLALKLELLQ